MSAVTITTSDVPASFCHGSWQTTWPALVALLSAELSGNVQTFNFGNVTPDAEDRDKPWFRVNADGTPDKLYSYSSGSWLALHPMAPGLVLMYEGSEGSIATLDGGESGTVSASTGPFWERVTAMDARFPVGPGTTANGTSILIGDTGGADEVALTEAQLPSHSHTFNVGATGDDGQGTFIDVRLDAPNTPRQKTTQPTGDDEAHTNMPPYRGIWFVRRTGRLYYRQ